MNIKGSFSAYITQAFIMAVIIFIVFVIFMAGGGLNATWTIGGIVSQIAKILAKVPAWAWITLALIWLINAMFRKK
jgi:hypothetical protein